MWRGGRRTFFGSTSGMAFTLCDPGVNSSLRGKTLRTYIVLIISPTIPEVQKTRVFCVATLHSKEYSNDFHVSTNQPVMFFIFYGSQESSHVLKVSGICTECPTGIDASFCPLDKRTVFKLLFGAPMNNLHSSDL